MNVDHLVYGVPDLRAGVAEMADRLGVRAAPGGKHVGRGTHNAILGLGGASYLEIIALDPDQAPARAPLFALGAMRLPRLVAWACAVEGIEARVERARRRGYDPGPPEPMSRARDDGAVLRWRLTQPPPPPRLVVPFLIDWGDSPHPSRAAPAGIRLVELRAEEPEPRPSRAALGALEVDLPVDPGVEPALVVMLETPRGRIVLR